MPNFSTPRRPRRMDAQERRNLNTGMRKLYGPVRDHDFDELLRAIARGGR